MKISLIHHRFFATLAFVMAFAGLALVPSDTNAVSYGGETMSTCSKRVIKNGSRGNCSKVLQKRLKDLGFYAGSIDGIVGTGTLNGVLNYQRSQSLKADAIVGSGTWRQLRLNPQPAVIDREPGACKSYSGRIACVSNATRTAKFYENGKVVKTIKVRLGGWTDDKYGKMRVHSTVNGRYTVKKKYEVAPSDRFPGQMPKAVVFNPNMYFHYSAAFAAEGYMGSSHGCVNIRSWGDAVWVYNFMKINDRVIVY